MKNNPGDITVLQDIIQSYKTKGPDSWSNLKDQRPRQIKPKGLKVLFVNIETLTLLPDIRYCCNYFKSFYHSIHGFFTISRVLLRVAQ